jgi:steroid delta-isomerase-like uncharacterized protein
MNTVTSTAPLPEHVQKYFDAWNRHDGRAISAAFAPGGTYADAVTGGPLSGDKIAEYAEGLWQAFPDLHFELDGPPATIGEIVYMPWKMQGTNNGPFNGLPATGKTISTVGIDVVRSSSTGLISVVGYFDSKAVPDQLGLQVVMQPHSIGPFTFGVSTRVVSGRNSTPEAFAVTSLEPRTPDEAQEIRQLARETLKEMLELEGFIAATTVTCGNRQMTFTAWEKNEHIKQMLNVTSHREAMQRFYSPQLAQGAIVSVWQLPSVRGYYRCQECGKMNRLSPGTGRCDCGAALKMPSFW